MQTVKEHWNQAALLGTVPVIGVAIGLSQMPCFSTRFLDNPTSLVIDFRAGPATT